jgi:transposase
MSMGKRRRFTPEFKVQVVLELLSGSKSMAEVCREYRLASHVVSAWRQHFAERATSVFSTLESQRAEQKRIADLERMVGRLTMELEVAKKASSILTSHWTRNGR